MNTREKRLIDLLHAKRREDPKGFREYLPGAAKLLPEPPPKPSRVRSTFGLTERELSYHRAGLSAVLGKLDADTITAEEAVKGLQHCAALVKDDNLPYSGELADGRVLRVRSADSAIKRLVHVERSSKISPQV